MNFVAQVEDHLRDLGAEARKNYPGVKEASERAIIHLRTLQTQYVAAVRRAGASEQQQQQPSSGSTSPLPSRHPTTALFQSQDVIRPFLLAANHPDASYDILVIALESIQHLLRGDAVCPDDGIQISRVLVIQSWGCAVTLGLVGNVTCTNRRGDASAAAATAGGASGAGGSMRMAAGMIHAASGALGGITGMVLGGHHHLTSADSSHHHHYHHHPSNRSVKDDQTIALKILRTITMLVDSRSVTLTEDVLGACLSACLVLGAGQKYNEHGLREVTSTGATIRERFTHSVTATASSSAPHGTSTKDGSNSVKRAAIATVNQLLSITFEKANDVMMEQLSTEAKTSKPPILLLAERTLSDLCTVVCTFSIPQNQSELHLFGPFSGAAKVGLSLSRTTCLALVDMVMKQIGGDLFQVCFNYFNDATTEHRTYNHGVDFATQLICQAFQFGHSLLGSQYYNLVTKLSLDSSLQESSQHSTASNLIEFCLYYHNISLATTLITYYLSSLSEEFYERFDEYACADKHDSGSSTGSLSKLALDMMHQLISFVTEATEAYHKSDDFEDGYIFTQSERESLDIGKSIIRTPSQPQPDTSTSNEILWRAFLALGALAPVVTSHLEQVTWLDFIGRNNKDTDDSDDNLTGCLIAKAASDFATSSASNRERILHLLMAAHSDDQSKSTRFVGDLPLSDTENTNAASAIAAKVTDSMVTDAIELPACDVGATAWLAFKCILFLVKSLKVLATSYEANEETALRLYFPGLINGSFAPSVSVLQHFIRRMLGSQVIVSRTLAAYQNLAYAAMSVECQSTDMRRQAILTSLCKLCLPSWGKRRLNCHLNESNIEALWTLLWIVHFNFENISEEWDIILSTLDQLAIIQIPSPKLPASYLEKAAAIAGCLTRLPLFTTAFSSGALSQFTRSLVKLSEVVSFEPLSDQSNEIVRENSEISDLWEDDDVSNSVRESSIGGKLLSFAGRAFGGGVTTQSTPAHKVASLRRSISSTLSKTYSENLQESACSQLATMNISTPRSIIRKIPLPLLFAVLVAETNSYRLQIIEETFATHLCEIVARSSSSELKSFAMQVLIHFMPLSLSQSKAYLSFRPRMNPDREHNISPLEVIPVEYEEPEKIEIQHSSPQLLKILCHTIHRSTQVDTAENCLHALVVVLEGEGHNLAGDNLINVINTLSELSGCKREDIDHPVDRSAKQWANVSLLAFQNLKLLLDDFLEPMSTTANSPLKSIEARDAILDCCVAFGRSRHDVNTSLTATGMLWSLADRDSSPGTVDAVLSNLALLAMDSRPELRNCSVNTLFSCVVGLGEQFSDEQWEKCLDYTIFGILIGISTAIDDAEKKQGASTSGERYKVAVHHSRDSVRKQFATTQILVLRGLERVLRSFFSRLLATLSATSCCEPWFFQTWKEILSVSFNCSVIAGEGEVLDMRLAGIEVMVLCAQLSCQAGMAAAGTTARVGTNMEVVGGALRSVRAAVEDDRAQFLVDQSSDLNQAGIATCRRELFDVAFDTLGDFRAHLARNGNDENEGLTSFMTIHSQLTQVLTKLSGELAKLYECCKCNELLPGPCELQMDISIEDDDGYESRFLQLVLAIATNAGHEKNSRYLNQVQRGVLSLLQGMASNSSLRAFKALITISGECMFVRPILASKARIANNDKDTVETLELEAAKTVASAFDSNDLSHIAKVIVMCSVLGQYLKHAEEKRATFQFDFFTKVIDTGLDAAEQIESETNVDNDTIILDSMWDLIIATVSSLLLPPSDNQYNSYAYQSRSIINIVAIVLAHLPQRKVLLAEPMLENGANLAVEVAFTCDKKGSDDENEPYSQASEGAVAVFLACFMGLCQKIPTCPAVTSLSNQILGGTFEIADGFSAGGLHSRTRQNLAIAVCESLRTTASHDLLVSVFPFLCQLTAVDNDGLRKAAGNILGGMNLSEVITRERERADQANARAMEIEEENNAMLEEIEYLQAENEELQRQLAVFSESSLVS